MRSKHRGDYLLPYLPPTNTISILQYRDGAMYLSYDQYLRWQSIIQTKSTYICVRIYVCIYVDEIIWER